MKRLLLACLLLVAPGYASAENRRGPAQSVDGIPSGACASKEVRIVNGEDTVNSGKHYCCESGNWTACDPTVGPGGADKQIQYNDAGALGAEAGFEYNKTTNTQTVDNLTAAVLIDLDGSVDADADFGIESADRDAWNLDYFYSGGDTVTERVYRSIVLTHRQNFQTASAKERAVAIDVLSRTQGSAASGTSSEFGGIRSQLQFQSTASPAHSVTVAFGFQAQVGSHAPTGTSINDLNFYDIKALPAVFGSPVNDLRGLNIPDLRGYGTATNDAIRVAPQTIATGDGDDGNIVTEGVGYDQGHYVVGNWHLWDDNQSAAALRASDGAPTSDTDGNPVALHNPATGLYIAVYADNDTIVGDPDGDNACGQVGLTCSFTRLAPNNAVGNCTQDYTTNDYWAFCGL